MTRIEPARCCKAGIVFFAAICVAGDFFLFRAASFNADYVQSFNELAAIDRGNFLLHGFAVAADSFYLTDLPFYVAGSWLLGPDPALIFLVPYIVFLLFLAGCCWLVWQHAEAWGARACGLMAVLVIFGIPYGWPQNIFLVSDQHGASLMISVYALVIAHKLHRQAFLSPLLLALFFAAALLMTVSDPLIDVCFVLPYFVVFVVRLWIFRGTGRAELWLAGALFCAATLGAMVPVLISRHGGFSVHQSFSLQFISFVPVALSNVRTLLLNLGFLFDARPAALGGMTAGGIIAASRLCVGLALAGFCARAVWRLPVAQADLIPQWLAFGAITLSAVEMMSQFFAMNSGCDNGGPPVCGIRFVAPVFVYLALAGILEGQRYLCGARSRVRMGFGVGLGALSLLYPVFASSSFIKAAAQPAFAQNRGEVELTAWLRAHQLHYGVSGYWTAPMITAFGRGVVKADTIVVTQTIQPANWIGDMADMNAGRRPQFVVFGDHGGGFLAPGLREIDLASVTKFYGQPDRIYTVGDYQVAVLRKADQ